ncbi:zinc-ribbon domain-containing protein [Acutalibacter muris]|uniref:zinc-ribbon domain-containing protein n=1 Tax=Acutalibacter muris TaxID=1796620 RepID=UPI00272BF8BC|nr:zinc-ribbon domain-containing protein [Acutalibacter muris]
MPKNVWWKCKTCGNEWKSVVYVRIKGDVVMKETNYHLYLNDSEYSRVYIFADLSEKQPYRAILRVCCGFSRPMR